MTLVEVTIALMLFSVFSVAFITGQGGNVLDSLRIKRELRLKDLAELKLNEVIINPPPFQETLTDTNKEVKSFEEFPDYQYILELHKIFIPDPSQIQGGEDQDGGEGENGEAASSSEAVPWKEKVFTTLKDNLEKLVWQVRLTVIHKESQDSYEITSWLLNSEAKVKVNVL